jgi:hypothetical protein
MNMPFRCPSRLIVAIALNCFVPTLVVPTFASTSGPDSSFKLAMGPMSAAQKNQNPEVVEKSDAVEIKPSHHVKRHHRIKHHRRHHLA